MTSGGNGAALTCGISLTTQGDNSFVVAGFGNHAGDTYTANTGSLRVQDTNIGGASALSDNTTASPGSVSNVVNLSPNSATCAKGAIELLSCGPPNYNCSYSGADVVQWPNVTCVGGTGYNCSGGTFQMTSPLPNLGGLNKNNAIVYDTSYVSHGEPSSRLSRILRCTDSASGGGTSGLIGFSAGSGGAGSQILFNTNSTLLHLVTNGGGNAISLFNPSTMVCGDPVTGKVITQDKDLTNPGSSSQTANIGNGRFSLSNPALWYTFGKSADNTQNTRVVPLTFDTTSGTYTVGAPVADFIYGLPLGANVQEWQPTTAYTQGVYVKHTMTAGEYFSPWIANHSYNVGDILLPSATGNPLGCGFRVAVAGTTGNSEPTWGSSCLGSGVQSYPDGGLTGITWKSFGSTPTFIYQLISGNCTSGGTTPAFIPANKHPDIFLTVTDGATCVWENMGPNAVDTGWQGIPQANRIDTVFQQSHSTNFYGVGSTNTCTSGACGGQGSGFYTSVYDSAANIYHLFNTMTQIQSDFACSGGTGYKCTGGSFTQTPKGLTTAEGNCRFTIHGSHASNDGSKITITPQGNLIGAGCPTPVPIQWRALQPFNAATQTTLYRTGLNHSAPGNDHEATIGQGAANYGYQTGVFGTLYSYADVTALPAAYWETWYQTRGDHTCDTTSPLQWSPFDPKMPCQLPIDQHISWAYNPSDLDNTPVCGSTYSTGTVGSGGPPVEQAAYQGEEACFSTSPTWTDSNSPNPAQRQWRFTHAFAFGTDDLFDVKFMISQESQDGRFLAWSTDWAGGFGSTTGSPPVLPVPNPSILCLGGFVWNANAPYTVGTLIHPVTNLNGAGALLHVYQAVAITTGISGGTKPNWSSTVVGGQIQDGGVTWQDLGPSNCRGDVVIVELK